MKLLVIYIITSLLVQTVSSQVRAVAEEIEDSYNSYKNALESISSALDYIESAKYAQTVDDANSYASYAESEISDAIDYADNAERYASYAEDESSDIECDNAEEYAYDATRDFSYASDALDDAESDLSSAAFESDGEWVSDYLDNALSDIEDAVSYLNNGVTDLRYSLESLENCNVNVKNYSSTLVTCNDLLDFIKNEGYLKATILSYTLDSEWLYKVTAYTYDYDIYVVAEIKTNEYSYKTNKYIFCNIPNGNWTNFRYGSYGDSDSYGERFHKYIMDNKCNCQ
ncbi:hypothetical protein [Ekhidna sp.]|uniref:hypothetical protein n=1 Tax=Ekhidna sp. TaxID=2608089 RepID=UPI003B58FD9F